MVLYTSLLVFHVASDLASNCFRDTVILMMSLFMLFTTTIYIPLPVAILAIVRIVALQRFSQRNVSILADTRSVLTFVPLFLTLQILLSTSHPVGLLSRRLLLRLFPLLLASLLLLALLAVSLSSMYQTTTLSNLIDVILELPYTDLYRLTSHEGFGRLWYLVMRALHSLGTLMLVCITIRTAMTFDHELEAALWYQRWNSDHSMFLQLYTIPGNVVEHVWSVLGPKYDILYNKISGVVRPFL